MFATQEKHTPLRSRASTSFLCVRALYFYINVLALYIHIYIMRIIHAEALPVK